VVLPPGPSGPFSFGGTDGTARSDHSDRRPLQGPAGAGTGSLRAGVVLRSLGVEPGAEVPIPVGRPAE